MSWETRHRRKFYYRAYRKGSKVVKVYAGGGAAGEQAAREDAARRAEQAARRQEELQRRQEAEAIGDQVVALSTQAEAMVTGVLLARGFHNPDRKGWRKRRTRDAETQAGAR